MVRTSLISASIAWLVAVIPANAQQLPAGPGKDIVEMKCTRCHAPSQVTASGGRSLDEWNDVVHQMIDLGADVTDAEMPVLLDYLAKNFPVKAAPASPAAPASAGAAVTASATAAARR